MRIAIITSGILPIPAVQGGAVENLIDFYLEYNELHALHNITVYSVYHPDVNLHTKEAKYTTYNYIRIHTIWYRIKKHIYKYFHKEFYYNYHLEFFLKEIIKDIKKQDYDIIIFENRPGFILPVTEISNAKIVLHLHNDLLNDTTPYAKSIHNKCDKIITVSNYIKNRVDTIKVSSKTITVHNGIDLDKFYKPKLSITREEIGFTNDDFIIIYSGRINKDKGVKELIQAFKSLEQYPSIKLLILGSSFFGNKLEKDLFIQELQEEAKKLKSTITFTGFIPYNQIPSYLAIADIAVIPSIWNDPFPTTILEAMASGTPIIATISGGIPEACKNCAILIPKNNIIDSLSKSILTLYQDPAIRKELSTQCLKESFKYNKKRYSIEFFQRIKNITNQQSLDHLQNENNLL